MPVKKLKLTLDSDIHDAEEKEKLAYLHSLIVKEVTSLDISERVTITLECDSPGDAAKESERGQSDRPEVGGMRHPEDHPAAKLSERQKQIADMLCNHYSVKRIANALYVSENTVKKHVQNIKKSLEIESSGADFIYALKQMLTATHSG